MSSLGNEVDERARRRLWRQMARILLSGSVRRRLHTWFGDFWIARRPDRVHLVSKLIPAVGWRGGKVLFVGCRPYTKDYPALFGAHGAECWTIDIDPTVARWGAPKRHVIGDIQDALDYWPRSSFNTIVLSGVFGFGLDRVQDQNAALQVCRLLLTGDGCLILGWNADRYGDPSELPALQMYFLPASIPGLAQRQSFAKSTHIFATFTTSTDYIVIGEAGDGLPSLPNSEHPFSVDSRTSG